MDKSLNFAASARELKKSMERGERNMTCCFYFICSCFVSAWIINISVHIVAIAIGVNFEGYDVNDDYGLSTYLVTGGFISIFLEFMHWSLDCVLYKKDRYCIPKLEEEEMLKEDGSYYRFFLTIKIVFTWGWMIVGIISLIYAECSDDPDAPCDEALFGYSVAYVVILLLYGCYDTNKCGIKPKTYTCEIYNGHCICVEKIDEDTENN